MGKLPCCELWLGFLVIAALPIAVGYSVMPIGLRALTPGLGCFGVLGQYIDFGSIPIGFDRFSIRMGWKWAGIDGEGDRNTTYISEFHPHIPKH